MTDTLRDESAASNAGGGWNCLAMQLIQGFARQLAVGRLTIIAPDGTPREFVGREPGLSATMQVHRPGFVYRVVRGGAIGFAEAYVDGDWSTPDLRRTLELLLCNHEALADGFRSSRWLGWIYQLQHRFKANTKSGSRRNIQAHYDLGNAFYAAWLDPTMTYSAARFDGTQDLEAAQLAKYRQLSNLLDLRPDHQVLEVGCGWGGFALYAAKERGCKVTALTISSEQHDFACRRIANEGLSDRIEVRFQDYRDCTGQFDRVASIEMFEAVGEKYWPTYFGALRNRLKPDGLAGLQVITIDERFFEAYKREVDFIQRYVFPGGMLPSPQRLRAAAAKHGLTDRGSIAFGTDYADTLAHWHERFHDAWNQVRQLGFDDRFKRLWAYYLAYCEAGFRQRTIDVEQVVFARTG